MTILPTAAVEIGLDACLANPPQALRGAKFGLLMNQASLNRQRRYACDLLAEQMPGRLQTLFSPQHGLWCEEQDNMIETGHSKYAPLDVPLYSLYSETRRPTAEMLDGLDCFVVDLQDVGTRVYTFIWTVTHCLEACAAAGIPMVILDRPNPLGGEVFEGPLLSADFKSFVGLAEIPMRHGLTIGEVARFVHRELSISATLDVVPMMGWQRRMLWQDTGLAWFPPSPNMPRFETALVYPGQVLLEGTNLSEGRGTTTPFEVIGAPYIDPYELLNELQDFDLPGLTLLPIRFRPTFNKWSQQSCGGLAWNVSDPSRLRSYQATLAILAAVARRWPGDFALNPPPYEYETVKLPIDILSGSDALSQCFAAGSPSASQIAELSRCDEAAWQARTSDLRLYD